MYVCALLLKETHEIVVSGGVDLSIHSVEKLSVSLKFEKCYPVVVKV